MTARNVNTPYPVFLDRDGNPLDNGFVFIGVENLEPVTNPIIVYWDEALTIPAAQPIRTINGYPSRNGTPSALFANSNYSMLVRDKEGLFIYNNSSVSDYNINYVDDLRSDLASTGTPNGSDIIGFKYPISGSEPITVYDKLLDSVSVKDFGAIGDGITDDTASIRDAINASTGRIHFPNGTYLISGTISCATSGVHIVGNGPSAVTIKADSTFSGTSMFILGNKSIATVTLNMSLSGIKLDGGGQAIRAVEWYGLRDGSYLQDLYALNINGDGVYYCNIAGDGTGAAAGKMSEGMKIANIHVVTNQDMSGKRFFALDGLFESQLYGCKALGYSTATNAAAIGFHIAKAADSRGVALIGCSVGNLAGADSIGIQYGEWAMNCWDQFTTLENIKGVGVYFHGGTASGSARPALCYCLAPRICSVSNVGILDPAIKFGDCQYCEAGPISNYQTAKTWVRFETPVTTSIGNIAEVRARAYTPAQVLSNNWVTFGTTDASNIASGWAKGSANQRRFTVSKSSMSQDFPSGPVTVTYSASMSISSVEGDIFTITATDGVAFSVGSPGSGISGQTLTVTIRNASGGALGVATWGPGYKMAAWTQPANGYSRSITFKCNGTHWIEVARTPADVPN